MPDSECAVSSSFSFSAFSAFSDTFDDFEFVGDEEDDGSSSLFENHSVKKRKGGGKMGNIDTHKEYVGSLILVEEVSFILLQILNI